MNKKIFKKKVYLEMADKKKDTVAAYIRDRERVGISQGYYRCEKSLKMAEKCDKQCYDCSQIYVEKK